MHSKVRLYNKIIQSESYFLYAKPVIERYFYQDVYYLYSGMSHVQCYVKDKLDCKFCNSDDSPAYFTASFPSYDCMLQSKLGL